MESAFADSLTDVASVPYALRRKLMVPIQKMGLTQTPKFEWAAQATRLCRPATGRMEWEGRWHWKQPQWEVLAFSLFRAAGRRSAQASGLCYPSEGATATSEALL
jgi:hypothetical protein